MSSPKIEEFSPGRRKSRQIKEFSPRTARRRRRSRSLAFTTCLGLFRMVCVVRGPYRPGACALTPHIARTGKCMVSKNHETFPVSVPLRVIVTVRT